MSWYKTFNLFTLSFSCVVHSLKYLSTCPEIGQNHFPRLHSLCSSFPCHFTLNLPVFIFSLSVGSSVISFHGHVQQLNSWDCYSCQTWCKKASYSILLEIKLSCSSDSKESLFGVPVLECSYALSWFNLSLPVSPFSLFSSLEAGSTSSVSVPFKSFHFQRFVFISWLLFSFLVLDKTFLFLQSHLHLLETFSHYFLLVKS